MIELQMHAYKLSTEQKMIKSQSLVTIVTNNYS